jgi:hypothetical protein
LVVVAATACQDVSFPGDQSVAGSELLVLGLSSSAPAVPGTTFWVTNGTTVVRTLRHADAQNTLYLQISFPAGSLENLNGQPLGPNDSVQVTVTPLSGGYGFTLSPDGLAFASGSGPTVLLSFGRYADATIASGDPTYPTVSDYLDALDIWQEVSVDRWSVAPGSGPAGTDEVRATVDMPGQYRLAARR